MADDPTKTMYPGFYGSPPGFGRIQRLEKGSQRLQRGQLRPTQGSYTRFPTGLLSTSTPQQVLDLSTSGVRKTGGVPPSGNTAGFAYTATTATITWYWDGTNGSKVPVITRADGSRFTVPSGGSGLTVSGLTANTMYFFLPFWNINSLCNIGWVAGTTGSPSIAFVLADTVDPVNAPVYFMQQTLQGNEALSSGFMTASTTATGTGGGGAGGGGGGGQRCVMAGTDIETLGDLPYALEVSSETEWVYLRTAVRELYCTYDHPLYHADRGRVRADSLESGDSAITIYGEEELLAVEFKRRVCSKHKVMMDKGHLFWANGFLSHNVKQ